MTVDWQARGRYSTDLFTNEAVRIIETHDSEKGPLFLYLAHLAPHTGNPEEPFQAPDEEVAKFAYIDDPERRMYAGTSLRHYLLIPGLLDFHYNTYPFLFTMCLLPPSLPFHLL
jgi:hypothetical protein